ncbi:MAG: hypothetical protein ACREH4_08260, partial [Vitreimonas sp.]
VGPTSLRYRALLSSSPSFARARYGFGRPNGDCPAEMTFGGAVEWAVSSAPTPRVAVSAGPMEWRLDAIGSSVRARVEDRTIEGRGYVETVRLAAAPWRLGVRRIRWGRFVGEKSWAVWNVVEGDWPFALFAVDGRVTDAFAVSDTAVTGDVGSVLLGATVNTVHDGDVVQSQLSAVAPLIRILARGDFAIHQRKAVRAAQLTGGAGGPEQGLAMDELVQMGRRDA